LEKLGIASVPAVGGLLYRVGPDPERDVVAFAGPDGRGHVIGGSFHGHCWLSAGDDLVDFSASDWRRKNAGGIRRGGPPVRWVVNPPPFIWRPATPPALPPRLRLGVPYYTPWGDPEWPDLVPVFAGIAREIDWAAVDGALAGLSQTRLLRSPVGARQGPGR
jgi:hypothetical protein